MTPGSARAAAEELARALAAEDYAGWDPYDALSSPLVGRLARTQLLRRTAIQTLRRLPVNPRPALRIPRVQHAKALALLASAHARLAALDSGERYGEVAADLADRLASGAIVTSEGAGWGYDFDVQTRWGYYRRGQPNAVVTSFAAHALLDVDELRGTSAHRELVGRAVDYAIGPLRTEQGGQSFFAYFAGSRVPIHNASVLVASFVARGGGDEARAAAAGPIRYTLERQRPDGSWPYGEGPRLGWVDGFHTGFVLQGLARWHARAGDDAAAEALRRGLGYYVERLIDPDGAARASDRRRYPIDAHAAGTALAAFAELRAYDDRCLPTARRVLAWTLEHLRRPDGRFAYRRGRVIRNSVPYVRWSDAHVLLGLAELARAEGAY